MFWKTRYAYPTCFFSVYSLSNFFKGARDSVEATKSGGKTRIKVKQVISMHIDKTKKNDNHNGHKSFQLLSYYYVAFSFLYAKCQTKKPKPKSKQEIASIKSKIFYSCSLQ